MANYTETAKSNMVFYARSDAARRQLLGAPAHFEALRELYSSPQQGFDGYKSIFWDEVWKPPVRTLSVDEQVDLMRNAARLVTPHGAFPSVWTFFLPPSAIVYEMTAACYTYTWLPADWLREPPLGIRHVYLSWRVSDLAKARRHTRSLELVHPTTHQVASAWSSPWCCCRGLPPNSDFDLQAPPEHILDGIRAFETGRGQKSPPKMNSSSWRPRLYKGSEY